MSHRWKLPCSAGCGVCYRQLLDSDFYPHMAVLFRQLKENGVAIWPHRKSGGTQSLHETLYRGQRRCNHGASGQCLSKTTQIFYPTGPLLKICKHQSAEAWRKVDCVHNYQVHIQWHSLMHSSRVQVLILTPLPQRSIPGLLSAVQAAQQSHWSRHWWWQLEIHLWQPHDNWGANIHCFVLIFP